MDGEYAILGSMNWDDSRMNTEILYSHPDLDEVKRVRILIDEFQREADKLEDRYDAPTKRMEDIMELIPMIDLESDTSYFYDITIHGIYLLSQEDD